MKRDFSTAVTGWLFVLGALMLWLGWVLMPRHIGTFFKPDDFSAVMDHLHLWIWMFRIHIFGFLILMMALVALASVLTEAHARVLAWPGIAVVGLGLSVGALAAAFYYHHGAWGAIQTEGLSAEALQRHVDALRVDTEYVTCLARFYWIGSCRAGGRHAEMEVVAQHARHLCRNPWTRSHDDNYGVPG